MTPPAPHLRLVPPAAAPSGMGALPAFGPRAQALRGVAARKPLGQIIIDMKAVDPGNMLKALALRDREEARIGDILLTRGWVSEADLMAALALQWGARTVDLVAEAPDARLIDGLGGEFCLAHGLLPWRRIGGATVIATARPEDFARARGLLPPGFGPVMMALAPERDIHAALIATRQTALIRKAEVRVAADESCRTLDPARARVAIGAAAALLLAGLFAAPALVLGLLVAWAVLTLAAFAGLKAISAVAEARGRRRETATGAAELPLPERLPVVSVMVPLFREDDIAPRLIRRIGRIDYPKELLDVLLVVEEDDLATQGALARRVLPRWMRVVIVPRGPIRTKPRALNFALDFCRGSIVGIWDAEDAPDPGQIRTVVRRFAAAPPEVVCLQGILDFYNARHNWITRCFAIEYAVWFRAMLPGLARLGLVVPLGGTTLFFRRKAIEELGGWDAHNVTEDADLGLRLARRGYRTELIDTVTEEEPNSRPVAWIKQRSRWQKGFAMTWASHMRDPVRLWRELGPKRFLGVQILLLGSVSQALLAPALWTFWVLALGLPHPLAPAFPPGMLAALAVLFVASETVNIALGLWATRGAEHRHLMKWVPSLQFYLPLASLSAWKALGECVTKPFYWDKTAHGVVEARAGQAELLPVLVLADPVLAPGPPAGSVVPFPLPAPRPARLHLLAPARRGAEEGKAQTRPARSAHPPVLTLVSDADPGTTRGSGAGRRGYVLGSTIAALALDRPGIEFQPRFEGF
ncbi:glycosyltransferase family 2 protein [Albidovulum sp.]|uniref:glycosyltransferase family 2 protein n=1 Tax=Albidovulum sp. TaxID=1872424 RepID=UPI0025B96E9B|nr:glycosyltransferase [Defluviimonas sp.]